MQYEHQEVVLMHYVKPLLLGLIMEKNLKLEDWILIRQAAIIATQKMLNVIPTPTLRRASELTKDHKAKELQSK
jgi:hypothetical protein